jgi:hypothetical protein
MTNAIIDPARACLTVVITINVADEQREAFLHDISEVVQGFIAGQPGFISTSFHRRLDAPGVLNYAQWATVADFETFSGHPGFAAQVIPVFQRNGATLQFARYEVAATFGPATP